MEYGKFFDRENTRGLIGVEISEWSRECTTDKEQVAMNIRAIIFIAATVLELLQ
jgi:hypothetical protein